MIEDDVIIGNCYKYMKTLMTATDCHGLTSAICAVGMRCHRNHKNMCVYKAFDMFGAKTEKENSFINV